MSSESSAWAIRCRIPNASLKNLLMVVADLANHVSGEVFASLGYYQEVTGLSKPTVLKCLGELVEMGVLEPTDDRRGRTAQIPVYLFHMVESIPQVTRWSAKRTGKIIDPLENGPPKGVKKHSERGQDFHGKEVKNLTTEPSIGNQEEEQTPPPPIGGSTPTGEMELFELGGKELGEPFVPLWEMVEQSWNAMTEAHPRISSIFAMSPSRRKKVTARANEYVAERRRKGENITPADAWARIFAAIPRSTFLRGMSPPGKGRTKPFKLDLDYVLRSDQFLKIIEGAYDDDPRYRESAGFDADTGRRFGPAEAATLGALRRLGSDGAGRDGRGNPGSAEGRGSGGASGGLVRLPPRGSAGY